MTTQGTTEADTPTAAMGERRLRRDAEENRRRLLEAADEVFAESGFEVTMDQIAARAGVGVGTAYRRFPNKEALLAALFQDRIAELVEVAERALAEEDPWQGIVIYLEGSISRQACDRGLKELVFSSPRSREYVNEARDRLKPLVDELVDRAHSDNCLRAGIESTDLVMVQLMLSAISEPLHGQRPEVWRRFLPLVIDGLRREGTKPLPGTALSDEQLDAVMEGGLKGNG
jgi:AcrR family transcriptional regulator